MPDTTTVERSTRIDAPASAIFARLVDFRRWRGWSPFEDLDPSMERTYSGAASGVGSVYEWSGNLKSGTGRMEMTDAVADSRVVVEQRNLKPFRTSSTSTFTIRAEAGGAVVTWTMASQAQGMSKLLGKVMPLEKVVGPVFEKGLAQLKVDAETV